MSEPTPQFASEWDGGKAFTNARLRERIGPSNPIYHLLAQLCTRDVVPIVDDEFVGVLNTDLWTVSNSSSGGESSFASTAGVNGLIQGTGGTGGADRWARMIMAAEHVDPEYRPALLTRIVPITGVTESKWEVGFIDGVAAGAVNVKTTPTSTSADYAVVIRDTDHNTSIDLHSDGTTDSAGSVASVGSVPTAAATTGIVILLTVNEIRECRFWLDGGFSGVLRSGPNTGTTLTPWFFIQARSTDARPLNVDYCKVWQSRATNP